MSWKPPPKTEEVRSTGRLVSHSGTPVGLELHGE